MNTQKRIVFQRFDCQVRNRQQTSLAMAMSRLGYTVSIWNPGTKSIRDMFDELDPCMIFVTKQMSSSQQFARCHKEKSPLCFLYNQEIGYIQHSLSDFLVPEFGFDDAFGGGVHNSVYACDFLMVSSYREPAVVDRIREQAAKYSKYGVVRIFGSVPIPTVEFCGTIPPTEIRNVFASAKTYIHCGNSDDDMVLVADHYNLPILYANTTLYENCESIGILRRKSSPRKPVLTYNDTAKKLDAFYRGEK